METIRVNQKITKKPKAYSYRKFPKKLLKYKDSIVNLKMHYKKEFTPSQVHFVFPLEYQKENIDGRWNNLVRSVEQYLDILILPYEYIENSRVRKTITIIGGELDQITMACQLLTELYYLVIKCVERRTREIRLLHRKNRRKKRRGNNNRDLPDARLKISSFKSRLLGFLESEIKKASTDLEKDPRIKLKGRLRRKRIKSYIWKKYKKRCKTRLR